VGWAGKAAAGAGAGRIMRQSAARGQGLDLRAHDHGGGIDAHGGRLGAFRGYGTARRVRPASASPTAPLQP